MRSARAALWNHILAAVTVRHVGAARRTAADKMTIPVGLVALQNSHGLGPPLVIFAAITLIVAPLLVLFIFTQRRITEGISFVGVSR